MPAGEQKIDGSDILVAAGRIPNTVGIGLELDPAALSQSMTGFEGPVLSESG
jgi:pyruvate/2-oxoglutarate dehydrogenase complex dihydrolipoamide dehydrogenase (E3) component